MKRTGQQLKGFVWLVLTILSGTSLSLGLPYVANLIPWSVEQRVSNHLDLFPAPRCIDSHNPEADRLFEKIVDRIYPHYDDDKLIPLEVTVISGNTINAFASLGGKIYVYDGLIKQAESPEELAGVLAHEIEHVRRRHVLEGFIVRLFTIAGMRYIFFDGKYRTADLARLFLNMSFSREQEWEADEGGLKRLHDTHVGVFGFRRFFERMATLSSFPAILSDHPSNDDRMNLVVRYSGGVVDPIMTKSEWEKVKTICH